MKRILVIGAGFSGTLSALHILATSADTQVILVDKEGAFGRGLAYSPPSENFKLNVRAESMGAFPENPGAFAEWLEQNGYAAGKKDFVARLWYGDYLHSLLVPYIDSQDSRLRLLKTAITDLKPVETNRWVAQTTSGEKIESEAVVLSLGNLERTRFYGLPAAKNFINPYNPADYDGIAQRQKLLILGASLTAVDFVIEAESRGFKGTYIMLSRHGRLPLPHETGHASIAYPFSDRPKLRAMVREFIQISRRLRTSQPVVDAIRTKFQSLWSGLSQKERKQFMRHVRPWWDINRHRIPESHDTTLQKLIKSGRLTLVGGRIQKLQIEPLQGTITYSQKNSAALTEETFDKAVLCIGPDADIKKTESTLIRSLIDQNILVPGPLTLGCSLNSDNTVPPIFFIGPLEKEAYWEITAVRELRSVAQNIAKDCLAILSQSPGSSAS